MCLLSWSAYWHNRQQKNGIRAIQMRTCAMEENKKGEKWRKIMGLEEVTFWTEPWTHLCCREALWATRTPLKICLRASPHFQSCDILKGSMCKHIDTGMNMELDCLRNRKQTQEVFTTSFKANTQPVRLVEQRGKESIAPVNCPSLYQLVHSRAKTGPSVSWVWVWAAAVSVMCDASDLKWRIVRRQTELQKALI